MIGIILELLMEKADHHKKHGEIEKQKAVQECISIIHHVYYKHMDKFGDSLQTAPRKMKDIKKALKGIENR